MFSQLRVFFSNLRPSQNIVFYDAKATFSFFEFLFFFLQKKWSKIECKIGSRKIIKQMVHLGPKMEPKSIKCELGSPKS